MTIQAVIDKYQRIADKRLPSIMEFRNKEKPFLISVASQCTFYNNCNTVEDCFNANISDFKKALDCQSDTLPFLEPWFGTGAYAEAFGCEYLWRKDTSPACHYAYRKIDEIKNLKKPSINDGKIFKMVLNAITHFKEKTFGKLPISMTDTQSAHDTATLILDAVEVFTASYTNAAVLELFLQNINDLILEFSRLQAQAIGDCLAAPGHIMNVSTIGSHGIAIADDNLAVAGPEVNARFLLPFDDKLGEAFGGVAIHSCGNWAHSMPLVSKMKHVSMIDCALHELGDPNPNEPEAVRDAFAGTDIIVQVRISPDVDSDLELIKRVWADDLRLIVKIAPSEDVSSQYQYETVNTLLSELYYESCGKI